MNDNKIGAKGIKIECSKSVPAELTVENLREQLHRIGLTCGLTEPYCLNRIRKDVESRLETGKNEAFGIYYLKPEYKDFRSVSLKHMKYRADAPLMEMSGRISASWEPDTQDAMGYIQKLSVILAKNNFDRIRQHYIDFAGYDSGEKEYGSDASTVPAIKEFFVKTLNMACGSVAEGINLDDLEAVCTDMFPEDAAMDRDYEGSNSFLVSLLQDYDEEKKQAAGVGAVYLSWKLHITNYKEKKTVSHSSTLTLQARSVMYDDADVLEKHFQFLSNMIASRNAREYQIPPVVRRIPIFDQKPAASYENFCQGIPEISDAEYAKSILLYCPDLALINSIDNTGSSAEASYELSVTKGFSNSSSISFGEEVNVEAGCEFLKMGVKFNMNLSFNSESSFSTTETISYSVPAGEKAYLYQGVVQYAVLAMDMETGKLSYKETGKYDSAMILVRNTVLGG